MKQIMQKFFGSWESDFNLSLLVFLVTPCLVVAFQPCMEWILVNLYSVNSIFRNWRNYPRRNIIISLWSNNYKSVKWGASYMRFTEAYEKYKNEFRHHPFSGYVIFSENQTFVTP